MKQLFTKPKHLCNYVPTCKEYVPPQMLTLIMIFIVRSHLTTKRRSVLHFPYSTLFSRVKGRKGSKVLPRLIASLVGGSLLRRAHFKSLRAAEAKNANTIKSPNVKAPKCTLFSIQYFIFQGQRSQGLTGLATAPSEHRDGQLTSESPFRIIESSGS